MRPVHPTDLRFGPPGPRFFRSIDALAIGIIGALIMVTIATGLWPTAAWRFLSLLPGAIFAVLGVARALRITLVVRDSGVEVRNQWEHRIVGWSDIEGITTHKARTLYSPLAAVAFKVRGEDNPLVSEAATKDDLHIMDELLAALDSRAAEHGIPIDLSRDRWTGVNPYYLPPGAP